MLILIMLFLLSKTQNYMSLLSLYQPVVTLSAKDNQTLSNFLRKGFERSVYRNEYKTKSENKNRTNECRYFIESNFVGVNRLLVLIYPNQDNRVKRFNGKKYCLPKCIIQTYNVIMNEKTFMTSPSILI